MISLDFNVFLLLFIHKNIFCLPWEQHEQISRQCLKRTLETLELAPDWDCIKPSIVNDEETEKATVHLFKKKKIKKQQRCESQKKTSCKGIGMKTGVLNKTGMKQHVKLKVDTANTEKSRTQALHTMSILICYL